MIVSNCARLGVTLLQADLGVLRHGQCFTEMCSIYLSGSNEKREALGFVRHVLICTPLTQLSVQTADAAIHYSESKSLYLNKARRLEGRCRHTRLGVRCDKQSEAFRRKRSLCALESFYACVYLVLKVAASLWSSCTLLHPDACKSSCCHCLVEYDSNVYENTE